MRRDTWRQEGRLFCGCKMYSTPWTIILCILPGHISALRSTFTTIIRYLIVKLFTPYEPVYSRGNTSSNRRGLCLMKLFTQGPGVDFWVIICPANSLWPCRVDCDRPLQVISITVLYSFNFTFRVLLDNKSSPQSEFSCRLQQVSIFASSMYRALEHDGAI